MKTIILSFKSAKLPLKLKFKETTDKINEMGAIKDREISIDSESPIWISYENISNVIHVLCGCRPAPTYRYSVHKRISQIDDIAKTAYYCIDNNICYYTKNNEKKYIKEITEGKKIPYDSHASNMFKTISSTGVTVKGFFTWSGLYKRYGIFKSEAYNELIFCFEKLYGENIQNIKKKFTFIDFLMELRNDKYNKEELYSLLQDTNPGKIQCTPIKAFLEGKDNSDTGGLHSNRGRGNLNALCINTNPTYKVSLDGKIVFFIDENNDFQKKVLDSIMNGTRHSTFFDGGLISVESVSPEEIDEVTLVSEGYAKVELLNAIKNDNKN